MSPIAVSAIVLSEDWAFYQHNGFDWQQIWDSVERNWKAGKYVRGGSTITQQVAKNVFLSKEKTLWRKVQEAVLTVRLERQLTKRRILEIYLNVVEFGQGLYGIGPAARFYFSKSPAELTAKEGAFLAMLLPSPKKYSVSFRKKALTPYAAATVRSILGKLLATHRISAEEYQADWATPLSFEAVQLPMPAVAPEDEDVEDALSAEEGDDVSGEVKPEEEDQPEPPAAVGSEGAASAPQL
jgi:monofunctional biosynthetic peptidoglycan transglycosylase